MDFDETTTPVVEVTRRAALAKGAAMTAAVWAAPAITTLGSHAAAGTPAPPAPTQKSITLITSPGPEDQVDPLVEVLVNGSWIKAQVHKEGVYRPFAGTDFVNYGDACASNGPTYYRVPFVLPAGYSSPTLSGQAQADNSVSVRLNSGPVLADQPQQEVVQNFDQTQPAVFSTTSDFVTGLNYLYLDVYNYGCPVAVDLSATVTYSS